jgi:N-acetylmuramoyl-L-alanine amidase
VLCVTVCAAMIALAGSACAHPQGNTMKIVFDQDPARNTTVGGFTVRGVFYASLTDLAQIFSLQSYENTSARKLEVRQLQYRIIVTAGNPYVVVVDPAKKQTVYQLSSNVIAAAGSYFVPMQSFLSYFAVLFTKPVAFETTSRTLRMTTGYVAPGFDLPGVVLEPKANGMMVRVRSQKKIQDVESWLRPDGWLYVTLVDVKADVKAINATPALGLVKKVLAIQSPTSVQLTFKLTGTIAATEIVREPESNDILISVRTENAEDRALKEEARIQEQRRAQQEVAKPARETQPAREVQPPLEEQRKRWGLDVIVIDAGHGGHDPGTIGVTGVREKNVTLGVALKLGELIKKRMKDVKVVYTRSTDIFIPLYRRTQIANEVGAKLFISIHGNSMPRKPNKANGFEVYLLRPGRTEEAIAIAERENAVVTLEEGYKDRYQELTDENFILVTMAQSQYVKSSEVLADLVQKEMHAGSGLANRGVHQAGFYVLVGAAMPNILVETGYLSNRAEEKKLSSAAGQQKIAEALSKAIHRYKGEYEKLLSVGQSDGN